MEPVSPRIMKNSMIERKNFVTFFQYIKTLTKMVH